MRKLIFVLLVAGLSLLLAACGVAKPTETFSTSAPVTITLVTNPASPVVGDITLQFTVVDDKSQPVKGADFDVFADHTDMSGMTMQGKATEQGEGVYAITADFSMSGNWKIIVSIRSGELDVKQEIQLKVK